MHREHDCLNDRSKEETSLIQKTEEKVEMAYMIISYSNCRKPSNKKNGILFIYLNHTFKADPYNSIILFFLS